VPGRLGESDLGNEAGFDPGDVIGFTSEQEMRLKLSARNQLRGTVSSVHRGEAIANVVIDVGGQRLVSSITVEAVGELGLAPGSEVTAVVKASDVIIATDAS
jgi:molybdopterin-binding protein